MLRSFMPNFVLKYIKKPLYDDIESDPKHIQYINEGRVPWSKGYSKYRSALIENTINTDIFAAFQSPSRQLPLNFGVRIDERCVEIPWVHARMGGAKYHLDAGCAYFKFQCARSSISKDTEVTLLSLDERDMAYAMPGQVKRMTADLRKLPMPDKIFDTITCISTLEHVGMDNTRLYTANQQFCESKMQDYLIALHELIRVLASKGNLFLTVPFGQRVDHGWLQVFDSRMIESILAILEIQLIEETIYLCTNTGWNISSREAGASAVYFDVHAARNRVGETDLAAAGAVACLHLRRL